MVMTAAMASVVPRSQLHDAAGADADHRGHDAGDGHRAAEGQRHVAGGEGQDQEHAGEAHRQPEVRCPWRTGT